MFIEWLMNGSVFSPRMSPNAIVDVVRIGENRKHTVHHAREKEIYMEDRISEFVVSSIWVNI